MTFSLTWLPEILEDAGLKVAEQPGWRTRGRGDVGTISGVMCHHTAGPLTGVMPSLGIVTNGRSDLPGPLAQLCLGRDGTFFVVAAGRANHAGAGNWQGITTGNSSFIGIEAENTGETSGPKADPWPEKQLDPMFKGVWYTATNFAPILLSDTSQGQYPRPHRRSDDGPGYHAPGG
jgi:N-acetylmuramoyl-L-alanine amidase